MNNFIDNVVQRSAGLTSTVTVQPPSTPSFPPDLSVAPGAEIVPFDAAMSELSPVDVVTSEAVPEESVSPESPPSIEPSPPQPLTDAMGAPTPNLEADSISQSVSQPVPEPVHSPPEAQSVVEFSLERSDVDPGAVPRLPTQVELAPVSSPIQEFSEPQATASVRPIIEDASEVESLSTVSPPSPEDSVALPQPRLDTSAGTETRTVVTPSAIDTAPEPEVETAIKPVVEAPVSLSDTLLHPTPSPQPPLKPVVPPQTELEDAVKSETQVMPTPAPIDATSPSPISQTPEPQAETAIEPVTEASESIPETPSQPPQEPVVPPRTALDTSAKSETQVVLEPQESDTPTIQHAPESPEPEMVTKIEPAMPLTATQSQPIIRPTSIQPLEFPASEGRPATVQERPSQERPSIQVRIGAIEVRATTPPPKPAPIPRPQPQGFDDYALVRNYINWDSNEG